MATYIVGAVLLGIVLLAARYVIRVKASGGCVGCSGKDGCGGCCHCHSCHSQQPQ